tara:strand:+ start:529 stop:1566 length:1038 start_codon:yes stop_codon:yes gene_type:complete
MAPTAEVVRKRLENLIAEALEIPGAAKKYLRGPITLNRRSLNIKFNRKLTATEKARLVKRLRKHMETGKTKIKVRFIGRIKVGINNDTRLVLNPLTGRRLARGGKRYKFLTRRGYREVRGILVPPEVSKNRRNERVFITQFAGNVNTDVEVTSNSSRPTPVPVNNKPTIAPVNVKPTIAPVNVKLNVTPVNVKPTIKPNVVPVNVTPPPKPLPVPVPNVPVIHLSRSGNVANASAPGAVPVTFYNDQGVKVPHETPGAVPVVFTNKNGKFVSSNTPGATPVKLKDAPSLTAVGRSIANITSKTRNEPNRGFFGGLFRRSENTQEQKNHTTVKKYNTQLRKLIYTL